MPWFPADASNGEPVNQEGLFETHQQDLEDALSHRLDEWSGSKADTRFFNFGTVLVTYTIIQPLDRQGSGCRWRVRYVTNGGTIIWQHRIYKWRERRFIGRDDFTVYPPRRELGIDPDL